MTSLGPSYNSVIHEHAVNMILNMGWHNGLLDGLINMLTLLHLSDLTCCCLAALFC